MELRENPGIDALVRVIPERLQPQVRKGGVDVSSKGTSWRLHPIWVGEGFPSDVQRGMAELPSAPPASIPVVTARKLSSGARELLAARGVSWADAQGHASIEGEPGLCIQRLQPIRRTSKARLSWTTARAAVAEVALQLASPSLRWDRRATVTSAHELARLTGVSYPHTSKTLSDFDAARYTVKVGPARGPGARREFRDPGRLLSDWAGWYRLHREPEAELHVPWRDHEHSLAVIGRAWENIPWGVSGWVAAERLAPFVSLIPDVTVYVHRDQMEDAVRQLAAADEVTRVDSGGRIRVVGAAEYVLRLAKTVDGSLTVPAIRVYGDMVRLGERGAEAAEHLREVVLGI